MATETYEGLGVLAVNAGMSILAMAMVIYLFGGYVDLPNEPRITWQGGPPAKRSFTSQT
jgi:hypothetical protein